jgi:hypothetical protein
MQPIIKAAKLNARKATSQTKVVKASSTAKAKPVSKAEKVTIKTVTEARTAIEAAKLDQVELPNITLPILEPTLIASEPKLTRKAAANKLSTSTPSATSSPAAKKSVKSLAKTKKPSAPNAN